MELQPAASFSEKKGGFGFSRALELAENICLNFSRIILFAMMFFTSIDASLRYLVDRPVPGGFEITEEYLMPTLVFLTMSYVFVRGGHVRVTMLSQHLPDAVNRVLSVIFNALSAVYFCLITAAAFSRTVRALQINEYSSSILAYPLAPAYAMVFIGAALISIRLIQAVATRASLSSAHD